MRVLQIGQKYTVPFLNVFSCNGSYVFYLSKAMALTVQFGMNSVERLGCGMKIYGNEVQGLKNRNST